MIYLYFLQRKLVSGRVYSAGMVGEFASDFQDEADDLIANEVCRTATTEERDAYLAGVTAVEDHIDNPPSRHGSSAYEIAVENGFEGTEAEWLTSLQGEDGDAGATGATGATGADGAFVGFSIDNPYGTPSAFDDEFDQGSLDAKWVAAGSTPVMDFTTVPGLLGVKGNADGEPSGMVQAVSDVDATFVMKVYPQNVMTSGGSFGFCVRNNTPRVDAYFISLGANSTGAAYINKQLFTTFNNAGDQGAEGVIEYAQEPMKMPAVFLRVQYISSSKQLVFGFSTNGVTYHKTAAGSTYGGGAIVSVGFWARGGDANNLCFIDWFRKVQ